MEVLGLGLHRSWKCNGSVMEASGLGLLGSTLEYRIQLPEAATKASRTRVYEHSDEHQAKQYLQIDAQTYNKVDHDSSMM